VSARQHQRLDPLGIDLVPGLTVVEASAGTGKTHSITRLFVRLLLEGAGDGPIPLPKILVVTFTEKGAQELVTRIRQVVRTAHSVFLGDAVLAEKHSDLAALRDRHGAKGLAVLAQAIELLDQLSVATIHGFCRRVLVESAIESRTHFRSTMLENDTEPLQRAAHDWVRRSLVGHQPWADRVVDAEQHPERWIQLLVRPLRQRIRRATSEDPGWRTESVSEQMLFEADAQTPDVGEGDREAQALLRSFVQDTMRSFDDERSRRHLLSFDDLLRRLAQVLDEEPPGGPLARRIRSMYDAALVDECQDTDPMQFRIFDRAFRGAPLFMIGDPKQSIYAFRGADVHSYLEFTDTAGDRLYTLDRNWRSTDALIRAVEALFTAHPEAFGSDARIVLPHISAAESRDVPRVLRDDGRKALHWWDVQPTPPTVADDAGPRKRGGKRAGTVSLEELRPRLHRQVANEIVRLLESNEVPGSEIAVLVHTNKEGRQVKAALDAAGVASVIAGDSDVLASDEGTELARIARAVAHPSNARLVRAALLTRLWGKSADDIIGLRSATGQQEWAAIISLLRDTHEAWLHTGIVAALAQLLSRLGAQSRILGLLDGERRLTNIRHVLELYRAAAREESIAPAAFRSWLARELAVPATPERRELRLAREEDAVRIMTIHKAKGLQFDVVFCPTLLRTPTPRKKAFGVTPVVSTDGETAVLDLRGKQHPDAALSFAKADAAIRDENIRLAYVALTRARYRCYAAWGRINATQGSALAWLFREQAEPGDIAAFVQQHAEVMSCELLPEALPVCRLRVASHPPVGVAPREFRGGASSFRSWGRTSFSALSRGTHAVADAAPRGQRAGTVMDMALSKGRFAFPRGVAIGNALHHLLERADFTRSALWEEPNDYSVETTLRRFGCMPVEGSGWIVGTVRDVLRDVTSTTVPGEAWSLRDVPRNETIREWEFLLPVRNLSVQRLADVFAQHGHGAVGAYAKHLRALDASLAEGFLKGAADLVVHRHNQWWIMDWKSNHLGDAASNYDRSSLDIAMQHSHYMLQYHLYVVAWMRFLQTRQPDVDPVSSIGGVAYVFVRGVLPASQTGWYVDRPSATLLRALDAAIGGQVTLAGASA
jgi:exodeoxyribonuclease V beta subunit